VCLRVKPVKGLGIVVLRVTGAVTVGIIDIAIL
jgi:hypothetical protein